MKNMFLTSGMYLAILLFLSFVLLSSTCGGDDDGCTITCDRGYQENCVCVCYTGWEGASCRNETQPDKIIIKKVLVTKMPEYKDPSTNPPTHWDGTGLPDLMLRIWREKSATSMGEYAVAIDEDKFGGTQGNMNPLSLATFTCIGCTLSLPIRGHKISLYNDNNPIGYGTEDNLMGGVNFTPYNPGEKFPNPIILFNSKVRFEVTVEYVWEQ